MADLLGLDNLRFTQPTTKEPNPYLEGGKLIVRVHSETVTRSKGCQCLFDINIKRFGYVTPPPRFRHDEAQGRETWLELKVQKYRCPVCKTVIREDLPDIYRPDEGRKTHLMTKQFAKRLLEDSILTQFNIAAQTHRVDVSLIYRVFNEGADERLNGYLPKMPRVLGMDEKRIAGGYRFVLTDIEGGALLDIQPDRRLEYLEPYIASLPNRDEVRIVCQDMWKPYKDLTKRYFKNAVTVIDKFHVLKLANDAVEAGRKLLYKKLSDDERKWIKRKNWLFNARWHDKDPEIRAQLRSILPRYPKLMEAYFVKEDFYDIYDRNERRGANARAAAEVALDKWLNEMPGDMKRLFWKVRRAVKNWRPHIMRYFQYPVTNNYTERLNGLIKRINTLAIGMNYETLRKKALMRYGVFGFKDLEYRQPKDRKPPTRKRKGRSFCVRYVIPEGPMLNPSILANWKPTGEYRVGDLWKRDPDPQSGIGWRPVRPVINRTEPLPRTVQKRPINRR